MFGSFIKNFRNYSLVHKLAIGQGALVLLLLIFVIGNLIQVQLVQSTTKLAANRYASTAMLRQVQYDVTDMLALTRGTILTQNEYLSNLYDERSLQFDRDIATLIALYQEYEENADSLRIARELKGNVDQLKRMFQRQIDLALEGTAEAREQARQLEIDGTSWPPLESVLFTINDLVELQQKQQSTIVDEMLDDFTIQTWSLIITGIVGILLAIVIARGVGRSIARPVRGITDTMLLLSENKLDTDIPHTDREDEIGDMGRALEIFRNEMKKGEKLTAEREAAREAEMKAAEERATFEREQHAREVEEAKQRENQAKYIEDLVAKFDAAISEAINNLNANAHEMRATASSMVEVADRTRTRATSVSSASSEMQNNVSTMASAIEEFSASIREVASQIQSASTMSADAVRVAGSGSSAIETLSAASAKIEDVVKLINDIAEQTNLLALNATIEAARAGDAGKGFAVVASEVKSLANQTAKATEDITAQISEMQGLTGEAVNAMKAIDETIGKLNQVTLAISSAVEEQEAATAEISRSVQFASEQTGKVTSEIGQVTEGANQTGEASNSVMTVAERLEGLSGSIDSDVNQFLTMVRKGQTS